MKLPFLKPPLKRYRLIGAALAVAIVLIGLGSVDIYPQRFSLLFGYSTVQAQPVPLRRVNLTATANIVQAQLPDLPLENQYISNDGTAADDNTLVSRIIRYHIYIKERPTNFRLDWKLTLADYLGAFERIAASDYPDYGLRENPMEGDIAAVWALSRQQRDRLVNTLYETFTVPSASPGTS
ncbi:MAG: hypothetical protein WBB01_19310 [Phormidesmis sp.]